MKNSNKNTGKKVTLFNFPKQYKTISKDINKTIVSVLEKGTYILGPEVLKFESELATYIGAKYALGVASGTDALTIAIKTLNLGQNDEVIIPANVYPTAFGVALGGVSLRLADVDPNTLNINASSVKHVLTPKTKAIVLVHLYGNPVDLDPILKIAKDKNIKIIEDCAQAIGAKYKGKFVGTFGDISCFSFYPTKNLGAYGDAGAIVTNNKNLYQTAKMLRNYGEKERYESVLLGHNSRLDEIQASILRVKLKKLDNWNKRRRQLARMYRNALKNAPIKILSEYQNSKGVYHLFVIQSKKRNELLQFLKSRGISTGIHYPTPVHMSKSFSYLGQKEGSFPVSERASQEVLSLPLYPEMSKIDVDFVIKTLKEFYLL